MTTIAIVTGTTRSGRLNRQVADWVHSTAIARGDAEYKLIDIADYQLPMLGEELSPTGQEEANRNIAAWSAAMAEADGFVFVTAEYNHSPAPALTNALSYLREELANKAAGLVGYGSAMGVRAVEHLRGILSEMQIAHVQKQGMFSLFTDFENYSTFTPTELQAGSVQPMLDQLVTWSEALAPVREKAAATPVTA